MSTTRFFAPSAVVPLLIAAAASAAAPLPVVDDKPTPQVDARGPSAAVTSLTFAAGGEALYAAGLDKVVRVWTRQNGGWALKMTYRVPIGPGNGGAVNAVALSPDGAWIAMAGRAPIGGESGFRSGGVIIETAALTPEQTRDVGVIYVASTANPAGGKVLRGHRGEVRALAFAPGAAGQPPLLVSAATERDGERRFGGVRLWDAESGKLLVEQTGLPGTIVTPGLAVWRYGTEPKQIRAALAWPANDTDPTGTLYLWDPNRADKPLRKWEADRDGVAAAPLGADGVLTGGRDGKTPRLCLWHFGNDREPTPAMTERATFPARRGVRYLPVRLAVVPGSDGPPRYAAVALRPQQDAPADLADDVLAIVDLQSGSTVAEVLLADSDKTQLPALAAEGAYVAVTGMRDHAVRLFKVADMLNGRSEPHAVLAGRGLSAQQVAFVDKGTGLWLGDRAGERPLSGGWLFGFDSRRIDANEDGKHALDRPDAGDWSFQVDDDGKGVRVRRGQKEMPPVRLRGADEVVTAVALRPPAGGNPGLLAVAYTERQSARTLILLSNPEDGRPLRLLIGHLQDVRGLAFSGSRPLLASVAEDQTVCVWSLADIDQSVGAVQGLRLSNRPGDKVEVARIESGSPAAGVLAEHDVIEQVGVTGAMYPVKDVVAFLQTVSVRRPGERVDVVVTGKGTLKLPVGRGVDERKPLYSLFLLRTPKAVEWIGWSPAGPYDFSSRAAEDHLVWCTNTGDPAAPVSYEAAAVRRKDYYREGILRYLSTEADLAKALRKWDADHPVAPPQATLFLMRPENAEPAGRAGEYTISRSVPSVGVGINLDYPLDARHTLRWRLTRTDGKPVSGAEAELSGTASAAGTDWKGWLAKLPASDWRRGEYRFRAALSARDGGPEIASETMTLRFRPERPKVTLTLAGKPLVSSERQPRKVQRDQLDAN